MESYFFEQLNPFLNDQLHGDKIMLFRHGLTQVLVIFNTFIIILYSLLEQFSLESVNKPRKASLEHFNKSTKIVLNFIL